MSDYASKSDLICCVAYFAETNARWCLALRQFWDRYSGELGRHLTHIASRTRGTAGGPIQRIEDVAMQALEEQMNDMALSALELYAEPYDPVVVYRCPFCVSLMEPSRCAQGYGTLYAQFSMEDLPARLLSADFVARFVSDFLNIVRPHYGLVHRFDRQLVPAGYLRQALVDRVPEEQMREFLLWDAHVHRCQTLVRNVYWGNVIHRSHVNNDYDRWRHMTSELGYLCEGNVRTLGDDGFFFAAPFSLSGERDFCPRMQRFRVGAMSVLARHGVQVLAAASEAQDNDGHLVPGASADNVRGEPLAVMTLEAFFEGNMEPGSLGCNLVNHPGIARFYEVLRGVRSRRDVLDVVVEIAEGRACDPGGWPLEWPFFSESVYVIAKAKQDEVLRWLAPLQPDGISVGFMFGLPSGIAVPPPGVRVYRVWWD